MKTAIRVTGWRFFLRQGHILFETIQPSLDKQSTSVGCAANPNIPHFLQTSDKALCMPSSTRDSSGTGLYPLSHPSLIPLQAGEAVAQRTPLIDAGRHH